MLPTGIQIIYRILRPFTIRLIISAHGRKRHIFHRRFLRKSIESCRMYLKLRRQIAHWFPENLGRFLYWVFFSYYFLRIQKEAFGILVWPRNSLLLGPIQFGLSDIDLTVVFENQIQAAELRKKIFRFLLVKEVNWYPSKNLELALVFVNPIELARDPILVRFLKKRNSRFKIAPASKVDRLVFLLRMFEANQDQIAGIALWQSRKWKSYFSLADVDIRSDNPDSVFEAISRLSGSRQQFEDIVTICKTLVGARLDGIQDHELLEMLGQNLPLAVAFFPHRFAFVGPDRISPIGRESLQIMRAQISWEKWGLLSQSLAQLRERDQLHLKRLENLLSHFEES